MVDVRESKLILKINIKKKKFPPTPPLQKNLVIPLEKSLLQ